MGTKERRDRERQEMRTRILDAARELFAGQGYDAISMRRIAEKIEYSPTAIYVHFKDKEALFQELCEADFRALAVEFGRIAEIRDPVDRLSAIGHAYLRFGLGHPSHYRLMFMTPRLPSKGTEGALERGNPEEDAYAFLRGTVAEAISDERLRAGLDDPDLVAQAVWAGVHGVVSLYIAKSHDEWVPWREVERLGEFVIDMQVRGLVRDGG